MIEPGYSDLPFEEKLAMMMTESFNDLMDSIYGTRYNVYVRACIIEAALGDCLRFFLPSNGIEVGCHNVEIIGLSQLDENDILRRIDEHLAIQGSNDDYEDDQRHPMQKASYLAQLGEKHYYFAPLACSAGWVEGTFFNKLSSSFCELWATAISENATLLNSDPEWDKAAERAVDIPALILSVCNSLITRGKTANPWEEFDYCSFFNQVAALRYEHNVCKGSMVFIDEQDTILDDVLVVRFADPVSIPRATARSIRKMLELTDSHYGLLVDTKNRMILGITKVRNELCHAIFGNDTWNYIENRAIVFKAVSGKYLLAQTVGDVVRAATNVPTHWLESEQKVKAIIRMATEQHRGTGLVFSTVARQESERLASCNRCIAVDGIDFSDNKELLLLLSSIDGALIFMPDGICCGIGAILDGQATIVGSMERGARYNSLYNYIAWKKEAEPDERYYVVVISEDGTCDAIHTEELDLDRSRPTISNG